MASLSFMLVVLTGAIGKLSQSGSIDTDKFRYNFGSLSFEVTDTSKLWNDSDAVNGIISGGIVLKDGDLEMAMTQGLEEENLFGYSLMQIESATKFLTEDDKLENDLVEKEQLETNSVDSDEKLEIESVTGVEKLENLENLDREVDASKNSDGENGTSDASDSYENRNESTDSSGTNAVTRVEDKLKSVVQCSKHLRWRITLSTTLVGFVGFALFIAMAPLAGIGSIGIYFAMTAFFAFVGMLGIMPSDAVLIRIVILGTLLVMVLFLVSIVMKTISLYSGKYENPSKDDQEVMIPVCDDDSPQIACILMVSRWAFNSVATAIYLCSLLLMLATPDVTKVYDFRAEKGFRYRDSAFKMPARSALEQFWLATRVFVFTVGLEVTITGFIFHVVRDKTFWYTTDSFIAEMVHGLSWAIMAALLTPYRRGRIMASLTAMNAGIYKVTINKKI